METERHITLKMVCDHYRIESSFLQSLNEYGLIEITRLDNEECLDKESLSDLERMVNMHYDLHINMEGIDAIYHLLRRMEEMQKEMLQLRNKLGLD